MRNSCLYIIRVFIFSCVLLTALAICASASTLGFRPVSPDELKMTSEPKAPGAPAIILYRQVDRDDQTPDAHEEVYMRIKILTEEGRKYGDIEIRFWKEFSSIVNLHARSIQPDGTIVEFKGTPFDKEIIKSRGVRYKAKTFTMPDVQVGSVLEYYYTEDLSDRYIFDSHWIVSDDLFTKQAKFSLRRYEGDRPLLFLRWNWNLPPGMDKPAMGSDHLVHLEAHDLPAFQAEDFMPPENELKARVDFIYSQDPFENEPDKYWVNVGKKWNGALESFIGKKKAMEEAVAGIVSPSDSPEQKLRKIYARVQQIRNTTFEQIKTEQEEKRAKEKAPENVGDIWKKQYGSGVDLTWLFLALARAAGFDASGVWVADRRNYFFDPKTMDGGRLSSNVVAVKLDGKDLFFDPGARFVPFGELPWDETYVQGLKLDKDGGKWTQTPLPNSSGSSIQRKADLRITDSGDLEGKVTVTFTGLEAADRRSEERLADDTARKKYLEDGLKSAIPSGCEVELTNSPDWTNPSNPLVAEFTLKVPGWIAAAGHRALMPVGLFSAPEKHLFDHAERIHPIYFDFPFERADDITLRLPPGWQIPSLPKPQTIDAKAIVYNVEATNSNGALHLSRKLDVDVVLLPVTSYANLRIIFQGVRTGDEQQLILQPGGTHEGN